MRGAAGKLDTGFCFFWREFFWAIPLMLSVSYARRLAARRSLVCQHCVSWTDRPDWTKGTNGNARVDVLLAGANGTNGRKIKNTSTGAVAERPLVAHADRLQEQGHRGAMGLG
jgi:hypothetical protein